MQQADRRQLGKRSNLGEYVMKHAILLICCVVASIAVVGCPSRNGANNADANRTQPPGSNSNEQRENENKLREIDKAADGAAKAEKGTTSAVGNLERK